MITINRQNTQVEMLLNQLKLKAFVQSYDCIQIQAIESTWIYAQNLSKLCELEVSRRYQNRVKRWTVESRLPAGKSFTTLTLQDLPVKVVSNIIPLCQDCCRQIGQANCLLISLRDKLILKVNQENLFSIEYFKLESINELNQPPKRSCCWIILFYFLGLCAALF